MERWIPVLSAVCIASSSSVIAATNSWNGGDGSWGSQQNWSLNKRPASDQDIVVTNAGTFTVTLDDQTHANSLTVFSLALSNTSGATTLLITNRPSNNSSLAFQILGDAVIDLGAMLKMVDASSTPSGVRVVVSNLFNNSALTIDTNASLVVSNVLHTAAKLNQVSTLTTAGGSVTTRLVKLGGASGSVGTWTILGGANLVSETLHIGSGSGTGIVNQVGGRLVVGGYASDYGMSIAAAVNSTGSIVLVQGQLKPGALFAVGERGLGSLIVSNGVLLSGSVDVGVHSGASGLWEIVGGTNICSSPVTLGKNNGATGQLRLTNSFLEVPQMRVADGSGSVGTLTVAGGKLSLPGPSLLRIGNWGAGTVWLRGGELLVEGAGTWQTMSPKGIYIAGAITGRLVCSGGLMQASHVVVVSHDIGNAFWDINGGTSEVAQVVALGSEFGQPSECTVSDGLLTVPQFIIGSQLDFPTGGGTLKVSGGQVQVTQRLDVGLGAGPASVVNINGGSLKIAGPSIVFPAFIGAGGTGIVNVSSGSFTANEIWVGGPAGSVGTLSVSGGLVDAATGTFGTTLIAGGYPGSTGVVLYTGGNLHARTITLGEAGFGSMSVLSNADFQPLGIKVANLNGAVGLLSLRGGMLFNPPLRQTYDLEIGVVSGSTGTVWVTDGVLRAGYPSGCFQDSLASVGGQGSGRLSATNSTLLLYNLSVGSAGTLECVDSQFNALNGGCTVVNSNVMLFVNSTGSFSVNLLNAGTVTVDSSTLTFSGAVTNSGTIIATNGVVQFLAGINNSGAVVLGRDQFRVTSAAVSGSDAVISWQVFGGNRYRVQASTNLTTYVDISPEIAASGSGLSETNYIDVGAVTNFPNRNYRVRQVF